MGNPGHGYIDELYELLGRVRAERMRLELEIQRRREILGEVKPEKKGGE